MMPAAPDLRAVNVLVTGAGGFLGGHVVAAAVAAGARVRAVLRPGGRRGRVDEILRTPQGHAAVEVVEADIAERAVVRDLVHGIDVALHLAGRVGVAASAKDPHGFGDANVVTTAHLLDAARTSPSLRRFVLASTALVQGPGGSEPPASNVYAWTKRRAEALCRGAHMDRCPPCVVLRSFNAFGPGQTEDSVMRTIIVQALAAEAAGRSSIVLGAADHARDFIFAEDVARGFVAAAVAPLAQRGALEAVDLGTGRATTVRDVVAAAGRVLGRQFTIEQDPARMRPAGTDPAVLVADAARARKALGWSAATPLDEGLRRTFEWFRARPELWR